MLLNLSKMKSYLQNISFNEASQILKTLLEDNPELVKKAYEIAIRIADNVDIDTIMNDVYSELELLDVDDLYSHSGRTRDGYVDPAEKAWEMFEEALSPFIKEMKKSQKRALPVAAKSHCIGIIKGLQKFDEESYSDFKDWVEEAPDEYIDTVVEEWKKGSPSDEDIAEVMSIVNDDQS